MLLRLMLPGFKAYEHHRSGMESRTALLPERLGINTGPPNTEELVEHQSFLPNANRPI